MNAAPATATTADFTFTFVAIDGHTYPVSVTFLKRLPNFPLVGQVNATEFWARCASSQLHTMLPRLRVLVTVDGTLAPYRSDRGRDLFRSGATLADQLCVALQMRMQ